MLNRSNPEHLTPTRKPIMPPRIGNTSIITGVNLTIIAILAVVTILGILWGMRLKRRRNEADRIEGKRIDAESGGEPMPSSLAPAPPEAGSLSATAPPPRDDNRDSAAPIPTPVEDPIPAAAPLIASPASEAASGPASAPEVAADGERPLTDIKGLGPKVAARLAELNITNVTQIAALDATEAEHLDARLGPFAGRMARDRWVEQARFLAAGDVKGFEAVFGRL